MDPHNISSAITYIRSRVTSKLQSEFEKCVEKYFSWPLWELEYKNKLNTLRVQIDIVDNQLIDTLGRRMKVSDEIVQFI